MGQLCQLGKHLPRWIKNGLKDGGRSGHENSHGQTPSHIPWEHQAVFGDEKLGSCCNIRVISLQTLCPRDCSKYVLYTSIVAGAVPARLPARVGRIGYDDFTGMDVSGAINAQSDDLFFVPTTVARLTRQPNIKDVYHCDRTGSLTFSLTALICICREI